MIREIPKTIVVLAHLAAPGSAAKLDYLESLDGSLRTYGFRLLLVDQAGIELETPCATKTIPVDIVSGKALDDRLRHELDTKPDLRHAVDMETGFRGQNWEVAARKTIGVASFVRDLLKYERAALCVLWHQFNGCCTALASLCGEMGKPVVFAHLGCLPRTVVFESGGQMAESWVARENERFLKLPVVEPDLEVSRTYLDIVRQEKADRKPQTEEWSIRQVIERHRKLGRKVVFYAGHNDYRTGIRPRTLPNSSLHSPFYSGTLDALRHLAELAEEYEWTILFKPHPNIQSEYDCEALAYGDHVEPVIGANVFECLQESDVTVTVVSQVSYLALIHERPLVLLGNLPLRGKGCAYEIANREDVARLVEQAVDTGFTPEQRQAWERHVAQLLKYYLFAIDQRTVDCIGRGLDEAARFLISESRLPTI